MPPKRAGGRRKRGKELVEALRDSEPSTSETDISPEYLETVIAELEHENERRVKKLKRAMGDMRQDLLNHFQVELLKIPRKVREMKVEHFSSEFGGSIEVALKKAAAYEFAKVAPRTSAASKTAGAVAATPARFGDRGAPPTAARAPRFGEQVVSVNGSPLAPVPHSTAKLAATIRVKHGRSRLPMDTNLLVELPTGDGGCVSLSEPETLSAISKDGELKSNAIAHLKTLQSQITQVMKELQA